MPQDSARPSQGNGVTVGVFFSPNPNLKVDGNLLKHVFHWISVYKFRMYMYVYIIYFIVFLEHVTLLLVAMPGLASTKLGEARPWGRPETSKPGWGTQPCPPCVLRVSSVKPHSFHVVWGYGHPGHPIQTQNLAVASPGAKASALLPLRRFMIQIIRWSRRPEV